MKIEESADRLSIEGLKDRPIDALAYADSAGSAQNEKSNCSLQARFTIAASVGALE